QRVLRRTNLLNLETNETLPGYSLGHDAIGLALSKWKDAKQTENQSKARVTALRRTNRVQGGVVVLGSAGFLIYRLYHMLTEGSLEGSAWVVLGIALAYMLSGVYMLFRP